MRCVIARFPFELTKNGVLETMKGVKPEPVDGPFVTIGRRAYPAMQVGAVITRQDRRDFGVGEVLRAMTRLGFTCGTRPAVPSSPAAAYPVPRESDLMGAPPAA
ncbi:SCO5918 family protein [Streptomyces sp. NPDC093089]|uniref:SCO5918 family protein n=1 Tax=Streptomyces sp. NPDC093089 TaxID=3366024 RepID=UPI0037FDD006